MSTAPIVIIGAGLAGSAAAWRIAETGRDVVVLERDEPAGHWGSSHGSARIFRYAYPDPFYAALVADARRGWDELEAAARTEYQNIAVDRNALRKKLRRHAMQSIEPGDLPGRPFGIGFRMGRIEGWRSTLWQIVFRHADHPVVLERRFRLFESSEFGGKAVAESRSGDVSRSRCILALCSEERHRLAF